MLAALLPNPPYVWNLLSRFFFSGLLRTSQAIFTSALGLLGLSFPARPDLFLASGVSLFPRCFLNTWFGASA